MQLYANAFGICCLCEMCDFFFIYPRRMNDERVAAVFVEEQFIMCVRCKAKKVGGGNIQRELEVCCEVLNN